MSSVWIEWRVMLSHFPPTGWVIVHRTIADAICSEGAVWHCTLFAPYLLGVCLHLDCNLQVACIGANLQLPCGELLQGFERCPLHTLCSLQLR